jgi:hypothetical protein
MYHANVAILASDNRKTDVKNGDNPARISKIFVPNKQYNEHLKDVNKKVVNSIRESGLVAYPS